jgi:hypothetical protein
MKIDGHCHCGAITYEADADPAKVVVCHCADCQTLSGSAFRVSVPVEGNSFQLLSGQLKVYIKTTADSGARREQAFCPECGTPIYAGALGGGAPLFVRVGSVRQRNDLAPKKQVWFRSAQRWLSDLTAVPKSEKG